MTPRPSTQQTDRVPSGVPRRVKALGVVIRKSIGFVDRVAVFPAEILNEPYSDNTSGARSVRSLSAFSELPSV